MPPMNTQQTSPDLAQLIQQLQQKNTAQAQLAGLDDQYQRAQANALRSTMAQDVQTGGTLGGLANLLRGSTSRRRMEALDPQRQAARHQIAGVQDAAQVYGLKQTAEKMRRDQERYEAEQQAKKDAADEDLRRFNLEQEQERLKALYGMQEKDIEREHELKLYGLEQAADTEKTREKAVERAKEQATLSAAGVQTGLKDLRKNFLPIAGIHDAMEELNARLKPYAVGGGREKQKDIPGIGLIEGQGGWVGDVIRYNQDLMVKGQPAQTLRAALESVMGEEMREKIGAAQTFTESQRVLRSLSAQTVTDENALLAAMARFQRALNNDVERHRNATHPQVREAFNRGFPKGQSPLERTIETLDFSNRGVTSQPEGVSDEYESLSAEDKAYLDSLSPQERHAILSGGAI